jgi:hypothetical protein
MLSVNTHMVTMNLAAQPSSVFASLSQNSYKLNYILKIGKQNTRKLAPSHVPHEGNNCGAMN